ncbi:hypothetical protein FRC09_017703 [Ceratobasidium sp. 395]|nr:hypothetical protein FRC09_017703 [Ceratobasidium sp. 395]
MSVAVLPAATGSYAHDPGNIQAKRDYWGALLPLIAQGINAFQSAQCQERLADAYSKRRHPSFETANAAQRATAQALLHRGEFEAFVCALAENTPDSVIYSHGLLASTPSLHDRVASLETQVTQLGERAEHQNRWLGLVEESTTRMEKSHKSDEEERSRTTAQLTKSFKQLEGKVSQFSTTARRLSTSSIDSRPPATTHLDTEKRLDSVDSRIKDFAAKSTNIDQRLKAVEDAQRKPQRLDAKVEDLVKGLKVVQASRHGQY